MLYIIYRDYDASNFILDKLDICTDIRLIKIPILKFSFIQRIIYFTERKTKRNINPKARFSKTIMQKINEIQASDKVLLFDFMLYVDVVYLKRKIKSQNISLWIWNTLRKVERCDVERYRKWHIHIFTFDADDAEKYGFTLLNQVYRFVENAENESLYDFLFIGKDKGRGTQLDALGKELTLRGYRVLFLILPDMESDSVSYQYIKMLRFPISYLKVCELIDQSRVIVDWVKMNQVGMTLRVLEAVFRNKKLMTNNEHIMNSPIYSTDNVFVLGKDNLDAIDTFISIDTRGLPHELLAVYDIVGWINNFK